MSKKYVPDGVWLTCDKGACFSVFKVTSHKNTTIYGSNMATVGDMWPFVNVKPMGLCAIKGLCLPSPVLWKDPKDGIMIGTKCMLLEDSTAKCLFWGTIQIHFTLEEAQAACPFGSFKRPSEYIKEGFDWVFDKMNEGLSAVRARLSEAGAPNWLLNGVDQLAWNAQFAVGIVEGAINAVVGLGEVVWDITQDPVGIGTAIWEGVSNGATQAWDWASKPENWENAANSAWDYVTSPDKWAETANDAAEWIQNNPRQLGNVTGEIAETAAEIALTGGTASVAKKTATEAAEAAAREAAERAAREAAEKAAREAAEKAAREGVEAATETSAKKSLPKVITKIKSLREKYLGRTPSKNSKTGREVFERMEKEGTARTLYDDFGNEIKEFWDPDNKVWRNISEADMGHIHDAVTWWNDVGREFGAKSPEVRKWMLDSDNYVLEYYVTNRSKGAILGQTEKYLPPK